MRIVLADPPRKEQIYDLSNPNLGILYLASYVRDRLRDKAPDMYYLEGNHTLRSHLEEIGKLSPDVYGLSFSYPLTPLAYRTMNAIKERYPTLLIVCGGPHPTSSAEDVLRNSQADICVLGEGEETFLDLIKYFRKEEDLELSHVAGIAFRKPNCGIHFTPKRPLIRDIDSISMPAWDLVDLNRYAGLHFAKARPHAYIVASRGCPFNCTFCSNPVWKLSKPWVRLRSPEKIAEEVKSLYRKGVREIYFISDELNPNLSWAMTVCEKIAQLGYKDLFFQTQLRADNINEALVKLLKEMNCWMVHLGVESANQRVIDGIRKCFTIEQVNTALEFFKKYDIKVDCYMMLYQVWEKDGRLCWETPDEVANSLRFCWRLFWKGLVHYLSWQVATPYPGSELYDIAKKHNILVEDRIPSSVWEVNLKVPDVPEARIKKDIRTGILLKDFIALKSGNISLKGLWRVRENIRYLIRSLR